MWRSYEMLKTKLKQERKMGWFEHSAIGVVQAEFND